MEISVFGMAGKLVLQKFENNTHVNLETSALKHGMYRLRVKTITEVKNFKIIKEKS